jgi:hypothetical protein
MNKLEQLGYEFGGAKQTQFNIVSTILGLDKNFATECGEDTKVHLSKGLQLRYAENHPEIDKGYIKQGEQYIPVDDKTFKAFKGDKVHLSVNFILSEAPAKFGRLKTDNEALYNLMKTPRRNAMRYISDTIKDMQRLAKKMLDEAKGETKTRAPNKSFTEKVALHFEKMRAEGISAKSKGDDTFDEARFRKAVVAFNTVWNHG